MNIQEIGKPNLFLSPTHVRLANFPFVTSVASISVSAFKNTVPCWNRSVITHKSAQFENALATEIRAKSEEDYNAPFSLSLAHTSLTTKRRFREFEAKVHSQFRKLLTS